MATGGSDLTSDEILGIKCCICAEENRCGEADKYCVQCKDYYCSVCVGAHMRIPALRGHKLLENSDFTSLRQDGSLPSFPTQRCPQHQNEVINMYCKDHDEVACASCVALCHRTCKYIHSIPEEVDILYKASIEKKIIALKSKLEELKKSKKVNIKALETSLSEAMKKVKAFRREIETLLHEIEAKTLRDIRACFSRLQKSLDEDNKEVEVMIDSLNESLLQLKKAQGNIAQEFVCLKNCEKVANKAEGVDKAQRKPRDTTFYFYPDPQVKEYFDRSQTFGKVVCPKQSLYKVKQQKDVNVKLPTDNSTCNIWGSCITEDGYLLLADCLNKELKRLLLSTDSVKDYIYCKSQPFSVCQINKTEAAVTQLNKTVQFISLADKMKITRTLTMNHHCLGIAHADGKLFITDGNKGVYIHDLNGQELREITTYYVGFYIFLKAKHVFISASGDQVYVADLENGLISLDIEGNYLFAIKDELCQGSFDACSDQTNVFVCGNDSNNILQIGPGNRVLGEIAKVSKSPRSVCYDPHKGRLIVSSFNSNTLQILELE